MLRHMPQFHYNFKRDNLFLRDQSYSISLTALFHLMLKLTTKLTAQQGEKKVRKQISHRSGLPGKSSGSLELRHHKASQVYNKGAGDASKIPTLRTRANNANRCSKPYM